MAKKSKKSLVIVESPTKARTINRYLGQSHEVVSSMGHVVDLPKKVLGVDIENDFDPNFVVVPEKKKVIDKLKKQLKDAEAVYLATDPDREGEAISWHIKNELSKAKAAKDKKFYRVVFHEITKDAIEEAFKHPEEIDLKKVYAQHARRVLDRVVGYKLSPLLWKKIARGLSAGRVQSVALRMIVERENEMRAFKPQEYWEIEAELYKKTVSINEEFKPFAAKLDKVKDKKPELKNEKTAKEIVAKLEKENFIVDKVEESQKKRKAYAPFTTSTLQQEAFNKLRFNASRSMRIAQSLYEGVELGEEGSTGLITYMRTDSVNVAKSAITSVRKFIEKEYGDKYLPESPFFYKSKKRAQEAHEAIRPTDPKRKPQAIKKFLSEEEFKLYDLIWKRFVASQMKNALFLSTKAKILAGDCSFSATGSKLLFDGFLKVYGNESDQDKYLPKLSEKEELNLHKLTPSQHFTKPPPRYSDASLVKALEENGIGRPSTYASIIYTLVYRGYVLREKGYFTPVDLGEKVVKLLVQFFPETMDYEFTATMENELDEVEAGKFEWHKVLNDFYPAFKKRLDVADKKAEKEIIYVDKICPKCGSQLIEKYGRRGKFLSCSKYPECEYSETVTTGTKCPEENCDGELVRRRSRKGRMFFGCSRYPKCTFTSSRLPS